MILIQIYFNTIILNKTKHIYILAMAQLNKKGFMCSQPQTRCSLLIRISFNYLHTSEVLHFHPQITDNETEYHTFQQ